MKLFFLFIFIVSFIACDIDKRPLNINMENNIVLKSDKAGYQTSSIAKFTIMNHSEKSVLLAKCGTYFIYYLEFYEIDHWAEKNQRLACSDSLVYYELLPGHENHFAQIRLITSGKTRLKVFYYDTLDYNITKILYSNEFLVD